MTEPQTKEVKVPLKRAISMYELFNTRFRVVELEGEWQRLIGNPELNQTWFIYGESSNGKTTFTLQLCKYLSQFDKVLYDSIEEGASESFRMAARRAGLSEMDKNIQLLDKEPISELIDRLSRHKSPNIVIIDSVQEANLKIEEYRTLRSLFPHKLIIYISRADGKNPDGALARAIKYCANVKIWIEGYRATCRSRYGGGEPYTIWEEGAVKYDKLTNR